jgi:diamine N-acetyltransferase
MLRLRPYEARDDSALRRIRSDEETMGLLLAGPAIHNSSEFDAWIGRRLQEPPFMVIDVQGVAAGYVQIVDVHRASKFGYIGIVLAPHFRGRGLGRMAMEATESLAANMGLRKLLLHVLDENLAAIRLYEELNYRLVGTLRRHHWDGQVHRDVRIYEKEIDATSNG